MEVLIYISNDGAWSAGADRISDFKCGTLQIFQSAIDSVSLLHFHALTFCFDCLYLIHVFDPVTTVVIFGNDAQRESMLLGQIYTVDLIG